MICRAKNKKSSSLDPEEAFRLYETYGFPVELTAEILKEEGMDLNHSEFEKFFKDHVEKSKKKTSFDKKVDKNLPLYKKIGKDRKTDFLGYEKEELQTVVDSLIKLSGDGAGESVNELNAGEKGEIILNSTVFYGEKGGQSGDKGIIKSDGGIFIVNDTQVPLDGVFLHRGFIKEGKIKCGEKVNIEIDHNKRNNTRKNHTSTHLLHWALRNLLGEQVRQSGSMVTDTRLRFDYSIYDPLTEDQLRKIEKMVNVKILKDDPVRCFETTMDYARELDAIALFDEKYGKFVRVVEIDDYNRELCGGTHAGRTGEIGLFKIISDSSIGANLRRIEAVTGIYAYEMVTESQSRLKTISGILEVPEGKVEETVTSLKEENQNIKVKLEGLRTGTVIDRILKHLDQNKSAGVSNIIDFDLTTLNLQDDIPVKDMGAIVDRIKEAYENKNTFIVLGNIFKDKPVLILACTRDIAGKLIDCGKMAKSVGKIIKGGGGGRPDFAQLGGSDKNSLGEAIKFAVKEAKESLVRK
jgi:alanyl-tRNA synthetase